MARRDCCCCSRHPAVVSSSITALVMALLAQGYLIFEVVFNYSSKPRWQLSIGRSRVRGRFDCHLDPVDVEVSGTLPQ